MKKGLLLLGGVAVAVYLYSKSKQQVTELAQSIVMTPNTISIDTTHILNPQVLLTFNVNNPTATPVTINKIYGTVTNNGQQLATINNNNSIVINAQQNTVLPIQLNMDATSLISDISDGTLGNSFVIAGYAQTGIIQVPFSETITINLPAPVNNALSTIESFL